MSFVNDTTRKEVCKKLKKDIKEGAIFGGRSQRIRLLAYGYIRGLEYSDLESKTHADSHCELGRYNFYYWLAEEVCTKIKNICGDDCRSSWDTEEHKLIHDWMKKRYANCSEEAA